MKKRFSYIVLLLSIAFIVVNAQENKKPVKADEKIKWMSFSEAVELNKKNPKKIFIDVYTKWCGWCKVMDAKTFTNPTFIKYLNKYYYAVKLDAEMDESVDFNNHTFTKQGNTHELASSLLQNKMSYPTTVFLDEKFNILTPLPGYRTPEEFEPILKFFGENKYLTQNFDEYKKTFVSELPK